jgi:hypothetical protein
MSLTSYRAALPRANCIAVICGAFCHRFREFPFLSRSGGDLLSHVLRRSTIGATALNGRVRDGIGCFARAKATRPGKKRIGVAPFGAMLSKDAFGRSPASSGSNQAYRAISTGQLNALLRLHLRPIDVVVFHGSQGIPCFEGGFPLRCLQRLSCPFIATQHCRWHDNWSTSGTFTPVLSY